MSDISSEAKESDYMKTIVCLEYLCMLILTVGETFWLQEPSYYQPYYQPSATIERNISVRFFVGKKDVLGILL